MNLFKQALQLDYMDWKIIATVFTVFAILLIFLSSTPYVSGFFSSIGNRLALNGQERLLITAEMSSYSHLSLRSRNATIAIDSQNFTARLGSGNINTSRGVVVRGYSGTISIDGNNLALKGELAMLELSGVNITQKTSINSQSAFSRLVIENAEAESAAFAGNGSMTLKNTAMSIVNDTLEIKNLLGKIELAGAAKFSGSASTIRIADAGIKVG